MMKWLVNYIKPWVFPLMLLITTAQNLYAGQEPYYNELKGANIAAGNSLLVKDEKFGDATAWSQIDQSQPVTVNDMLVFEINFDTAVYFYNQPFNCTLNVTLHTYNNPNDTTQETGTPQTINLVLRYDTTTGSPYKGIAMYKFNGAYKIKADINSITSGLPAIFRFYSKIIVDRKYNFNDSSTDITNYSFRTSAPNTPDDDQLIINWVPGNYPGAEMFDLEWTVIDSMSLVADTIRAYLAGSDTIPGSMLGNWFKNNSTRVTTASNSYTLNLPYNSGFILYRIRGVQIHEPDGIRWEGNWNYNATLVGSGINGQGIVAIAWHEENLNWQYSAVFAEEGKKKEVLSYFDGALYNRQSVTLSNSDNKSIVQETIYDALGRPSVNILPVPAEDSTIHYFRGFNKNQSGDPYSFADFITGSNCGITAAAMASNAGASKYYSANNPFQNTGYAKYIPDAQDYPFTVTEFMPDNTGRIKRQGGVGQAFQLNNGHDTKYYYGKPTQDELDRLFGNEAGNSSHFLKNMVMDPNGQFSVSYVDAAGKTVATALAAKSPDNLLALNSNNASTIQPRTANLILPENFDKDASDYSFTATATFLAAVTGNYKFNYQVDPLKLEVLHGPNNEYKICNNCYYDLLVTVSDNCSAPVHTESRPFNMNSLDTSCSVNPPAINDSFNVAINQPGDYYVTYKLKISKEALDYFDSVHIEKNTNLLKYNDFLRDELSNADFSSCYSNCKTCLDDLGEKEDFNLKFKQLYADDSIVYSVDDSLLVNNIYDSLLANCQQLQASCPSSPCDDQLELLKADVAPGGQYALYDSSGFTLKEPAINVLSHYQEVIAYHDENGNPDSLTYINTAGEDSVKVAINQLPLRDFILNWKDEWADSLVRFHPEYCYYLWCLANGASAAFDASLDDDITDADTAVNRGYYNRNDFAALLKKDPFFATGGKGAAYYNNMYNDLKDFSHTLLRESFPSTNILKFIDWVLYCRNQTNGYDTCQVDSACRAPNREWDLYKQFYLNLKEKYNEIARLADPQFANCGNCYIGKDILEVMGANVCTAPPLTDFSLSDDGVSKITVNYNNTLSGVDHPLQLKIKFTNCNNQPCANDTLTIVFNRGQSTGTINYLSGQSGFQLVSITCYNGNYTPYTTTSCNYSCPDGSYHPIDRPGRSYYIQQGNPFTLPVGVPGAYGNCRFYSIFNVNSGGGSSCQFTNVWVCTYDTACGAPSCDTLSLPPSSCPSNPNADLYKDKIRRYNSYVNTDDFIDQVLSVNPQQNSSVNQQASVEECKSYCEVQADSWIYALRRCNPDTNLLGTLKQELIKICESGCDGYHPFGSSTTPPGSALQYKTFEEAIIGILGPSAINDSCAAELIDQPYPFELQPNLGKKTIEETNADICNQLRIWNNKFVASGDTGTLHNYLLKNLAGDYDLTEDELADMQKSCSGCNGILNNAIVLPLAFDSAARPCLVCDSAKAMRDSFAAKFPGVQVTSPDYATLFTNYFNHRLGLTLTYDDYTTFLDSCTINTNYTGTLCNQTAVPSYELDDNSCTASLFATAVTNAQTSYDTYIDSVHRDFREAYLTKCMNVQPRLLMSDSLYEYHYTLYYYDQSGNLVKTIPPEGVQMLTAQQMQDVLLYRKLQNEGCYQYSDSVKFNNNGYIDFSDSSGFENNPFTVEAYLNLTSYADQVLVSKQRLDTGYYRGFIISIKNNQLVVSLKGVDTTAQLEARAVSSPIDGLIVLNTWTHIAVIRTGSLTEPIRLFINGMPVTVSFPVNNLVNNTVATNASLLLAEDNTVGTPQFTGTIKNFRVYTRVISVSEIKQNAFNLCQTPASSVGLKLWAPVNDATNNVIKDIAQGNNGQLHNLSWTAFNGVYPDHGLPTTYQYNSLNQVTQQYSPDADTSRFWYDRLGRLTVSQNSEQLHHISYNGSANRYSYTLYDGLGRIAEVGEKSGAASITSINTKDNAALAGWLATGSNNQVTQTIYDAVNTSLVTQSSITNNQTYLRKRVVASLFKEDGAATTYDNATHYSYDINGNVKTLWQEIGALRPYSDNGIKRVDYDYDLVSGKVNMVSYQQGKGDQFYYTYHYDADNRVIASLSSRDGLLWMNDATYKYYLHGPLARTELGQQKVQGIDYAYTLQGWLKGINSYALDASKEMGNDGWAGTLYARVSRDAYAFTLGYYSGDYLPVGTGSGAFGLTYTPPTGGAVSGSGSQLFNGNISYTTLALNKINSGNIAGYSYTYDQLNRLKEMNRHNISGTTWSNNNIIADYKEKISYDANGNILKYVRRGAASQLAMDSLTYNYNRDGNGRLLDNRLAYVDDSIPAGNYSVDIDDQAPGNYTYDNIGNLKSDVSENITNIDWTVYGKIKAIAKSAGPSVNYEYDAGGNRIVKKVSGGADTITYYVRDAQGNTLAVYKYLTGLTWEEQHLYGSSRLGMWKWGAAIPATAPNAPENGNIYDSLLYGSRNYELNNHLGNVLTVISDKKIGNDSSGVVNYYVAEVLSQNDYYPFGMMQPGRSYSAGSAYRYGFNGHEKADEIAGQGNHTTAEFGEYDTRLGKRWNLDPKPNPSISNYTVFVLNPIFFNDAKLDSPIIPTNTSKIDKDYKPWTSLLQRNAPGNLLKQANKRFYIQEFKDQRLSQATGVDLNLDFYKLNITKLPSGFATIGEVFSYIRIHFSEFVNGPVSRMEAYDEGERKLWESSNPSSAIIRFRGYKNGRNLDDADVLTTNYTYSNDYASWTFRPISNLNLVNPLFGGDKGHPLGGNREFGVLKSGNNYIFYIQAVDRLWSVLDEVVVGKLNDGDFFKLADKLWRQVMNNVANKINSMGGQASFDSDGVISKRISYTSDVKQSDKEQIKKAGN